MRLRTSRVLRAAPFVGLIVVAGAEVRTVALQGGPAGLEPLLQRVQSYVEDNQRQAGLILCDEASVQEISTARKVGAGPLGSTRTTRRVLESELLQVWVPTANRWIGFRDVAKVDGAAVSDRQHRLETLLLGDAASLTSLRQLADESARFNIGPADRNFNEPTFALCVVSRSQIQRFRFDDGGEQPVEGTRLRKVRYRETRSPTFIRSGRLEAPVRGVLWVDPESGRVHRTEMRLRDPATGADASILVEFRH